MTFGAALHNPVFQLYLMIVAAVLLFAGLVLSLFTWGLSKDMPSVWAAYRSWLVMTPLLAIAIVLGRGPTIIFFVILAIFACKELARATGLYKDWCMTGAVYLAIAAVGVTILASNPYHAQPGGYGLFMASPVFAISFFLMIPIARNRAQGQLKMLSLAILAFIYIGWMFLHLACLLNSDHPYGYLLYLVLAMELNDVAAFTFGRILGKSGKHLIRGNISPKKTWEGAIGALCVSMVLPWLMRFSFPQFGALQLVFTGLIVGVGGQLGDLSISVIKRDVGVKDMGALIPGHGGVLDRIDSLIYTSPLFLHMVDHFYNLR
jgi:phosphatidate cytidylyltransferase